MEEALATEINEIVKLVSGIPENLQLRCFEMLVADCLQRRSAGSPPAGSGSTADPPHADPGTGGGQQDIQLSDIHLKASKFLDQQKLTIEHLNQLFYREDGATRPLYDDLKTTKLAPIP